VKGICGHADITAAFPQDHGTHTDPGASFPWSTFLGYVAGTSTTQGDDDVALDPLQGRYFEGRNWAGAALTVASRDKTSASPTLAKVVETMPARSPWTFERARRDPTVGADLRGPARHHGDADIAAQVRAALADAGHEVARPPPEAAVRGDRRSTKRPSASDG
jgi:hypothetical protein